MSPTDALSRVRADSGPPRWAAARACVLALTASAVWAFTAAHHVNAALRYGQ